MPGCQYYNDFLLMPRMIKSSSRVTYLPINLRQEGAGGPQIYNRHISNAVFFLLSPCQWKITQNLQYTLQSLELSHTTEMLSNINDGGEGGAKVGGGGDPCLCSIFFPLAELLQVLQVSFNQKHQSFKSIFMVGPLKVTTEVAC